MIKLKDIANIRTGVHLKQSPRPNSIYHQVSDYDYYGTLLHALSPLVEVSGNSKHKLIDNDILFAAKGTKNFAVIYKDNAVQSYASPSFIIIQLKECSTILSEYITWYLNLPSSIFKLQRSAKGSSILSITKETIENFEITLPSPEKQRVILELSKLQKREQYLYSSIAIKQKQLIDLKLKNTITDVR